MKKTTKSSWYKLIRPLYLYTVSGITLIMTIVSTVGLIDLGIKEYVLDVKDWTELNREYWQCNKENLENSGYESAEICREVIDSQRAVEAANNVKRDLAGNISMILVAFPLYIFHWMIIKKEKN